MPQPNGTPDDFDPMTSPQRYVHENRDDLIDLIKHGDPFIRTLGLALLYRGGQEADIDSVIRELELLKQVDDDVLAEFSR